MMTSDCPVLTSHQDGTITMEWFGPPTALVSREYIEAFLVGYNSKVIQLLEAQEEVKMLRNCNKNLLGGLIDAASKRG